jgi:hypothetical protein
MRPRCSGHHPTMGREVGMGNAICLALTSLSRSDSNHAWLERVRSQAVHLNVGLVNHGVVH